MPLSTEKFYAYGAGSMPPPNARSAQRRQKENDQTVDHQTRARAHLNDDPHYTHITSRESRSSNFSRRLSTGNGIHSGLNESFHSLFEPIENNSQSDKNLDMSSLIREELRSVFDEANLSSEKREETIAGLIAALVEGTNTAQKKSWSSVIAAERHGERPGLPAIAPAIWTKDHQPGESPPDFIKRHYAPYLRVDGSGLSRADLNRLDPSAYRALAKWLCKGANTLPSDCPLPTKAEQNDAELKKLSGQPTSEEIRNYNRLKRARQRREL